MGKSADFRGWLGAWFKDVSVSRYLTDGTHSITVEEIVDGIGGSTDPTSVHTIVRNKINYSSGGINWYFDTPFLSIPTIGVGTELLNLVDSVYPLSVKIVAVTTTKVTIKVYNILLIGGGPDLLLTECATDDVIVHITAVL